LLPADAVATVPNGVLICKHPHGKKIELDLICLSKNPVILVQTVTPKKITKHAKLLKTNLF